MRRLLDGCVTLGVAWLLVLGASTGCDDGGGGGSADTDTDVDTDSDTDTDTDVTENIADYGTTDLTFDPAPIPDPKADLPLLENTDPEYTPALDAQQLPDASTEIHEIDQVVWYLGYGDVGVLADDLRANGVARQLTPSSDELMAEALSAVAGAPWDVEPGVLLTSDAVFNTFHNFYDNLLLGVELRTLRPRVLAMLGEVKAEAAMRYNSLPDGPTKDAALDVVSYLLVAERLMEPETPIIVEVQDDVIAEIDLVGNHEGPDPSPVFDRPEVSEEPCVNCDPCGSECGWYEGEEFIPCPERYCEDYSQYVPRGHYTYSELLEQYFRSLMWLGRATFLNRSDQSTRGAVVLIDSLKDAQVEIGDETVPATEIWVQFFRVIGTFVGAMDDLNASEVDAAVVEAMGGGFDLSALDDDGVVTAIHEQVDQLHDPEILSGFLNALADMGEATKGLRLMGQVFLPDSYAMGQVVFGNVGPSQTVAYEEYEAALGECGITPNTDPEILTEAEARCVCLAAWDAGDWNVCRGLPSGLDVAALLSNELALELALERYDSYAGYPAKLNELIAEFSGYDLERWGMSVAWTWLYSLDGLFAPVDPGAPAFMRTETWEKKVLETGLTSWAELRHDTILYVKQSYTGDGDGDSDSDTDTDIDYDFDYVEPQPEAYARLGAATRRLENLAIQEDLFQGEAAEIAEYVDQLGSFLERAEEISIEELEGADLTASDISWIRNAGGTIGYLENGLLECLELYTEDEEPDPDRLKTTIIADVHTWGAKGVVLEVGSGYLDYIAVLHQLPAGEWGVAVGPAFSYHEFEQPMADRLTDEEWREILEGDPDHGHPDWLDW